MPMDVSVDRLSKYAKSPSWNPWCDSSSDYHFGLSLHDLQAFGSAISKASFGIKKFTSSTKVPAGHPRALRVPSCSSLTPLIHYITGRTLYSVRLGGTQESLFATQWSFQILPCRSGQLPAHFTMKFGLPIFSLEQYSEYYTRYSNFVSSRATLLVVRATLRRYRRQH